MLKYNILSFHSLKKNRDKNNTLQQVTQCNTVIISFVFNIGKLQKYYDSLHCIICVSCWKAPNIFRSSDFPDI